MCFDLSALERGGTLGTNGFQFFPYSESIPPPPGFKQPAGYSFNYASVCQTAVWLLRVGNRKFTSSEKWISETFALPWMGLAALKSKPQDTFQSDDRKCPSDFAVCFCSVINSDCLCSLVSTPSRGKTQIQPQHLGSVSIYTENLASPSSHELTRNVWSNCPCPWLLSQPSKHWGYLSKRGYSYSSRPCFHLVRLAENKPSPMLSGSIAYRTEFSNTFPSRSFQSMFS